jgi:hypothetical protein
MVNQFGTKVYEKAENNDEDDEIGRRKILKLKYPVFKPAFELSESHPTRSRQLASGEQKKYDTLMIPR